MLVIPESRSDIRDPVPLRINVFRKKSLGSGFRRNDEEGIDQIFPYSLLFVSIALALSQFKAQSYLTRIKADKGGQEPTAINKSLFSFQLDQLLSAFIRVK